MSNKEDNLPCREDDECLDDDESTALPFKRRRTDSFVLELNVDSAQQTPASHGYVDDFTQKPLALDMTATLENDEEAHTKPVIKQSPLALETDDETRQKTLAPKASATLRYDEASSQKALVSDWIPTIDQIKDTQPETLTVVSSETPEKDKKTYLKPLTSSDSSDITNPETLLAVSDSIIPNVPDDSHDELLLKPKYNIHVMLPDRQNLERHAGTLIDIYNDNHSK